MGCAAIKRKKSRVTNQRRIRKDRTWNNEKSSFNLSDLRKNITTIVSYYWSAEREFVRVINPEKKECVSIFVFKLDWLAGTEQHPIISHAYKLCSISEADLNDNINSMFYYFFFWKPAPPLGSRLKKRLNVMATTAINWYILRMDSRNQTRGPVVSRRKNINVNNSPRPPHLNVRGIRLFLYHSRKKIYL